MAQKPMLFMPLVRLASLVLKKIFVFKKRTEIEVSEQALWCAPS